MGAGVSSDGALFRLNSNGSAFVYLVVSRHSCLARSSSRSVPLTRARKINLQLWVHRLHEWKKTAYAWLSGKKTTRAHFSNHMPWFSPAGFSVLSHPIPSHLTPSHHPIRSHPIPSHLIPSHLTLSHLIPTYLTLSHPIHSHPIPFHPILSHPISSQEYIKNGILSRRTTLWALDFRRRATSIST